LFRSSAPLQTRSARDGSKFDLLAVSYGRQHRYVDGNGLQRLAVAINPAFGRALGATVSETALAKDGLVFWLRRREPGANGAATSSAYLRAVAFDEHGCEYRQSSGISFPQAPGLVTTHSVTLAAFPRRAKTVGLRLQRESGAPTPVVEFVIPNPARGPFPRWQPEPLPATRRAGGVEFTLAEFSTGVKTPSYPNRADWTGVTLRCTRNGRPTRDWAENQIQLEDATGNRLDFDSWATEDTAGGQRILFGAVQPLKGPALCPLEPAWKVRVTWARVGVGAFAPSELWTVRRVPVPRGKALVPCIRAATLRGTRMVLEGTVPAHVVPPHSLWGGWDSPTVRMSTSPIDLNVRIDLVRAVDDRGREVKTLGGGTSTDGINRSHLFAVEPAAGARTMDLTFALQRPRVTEFIARPGRSPGK
ncbi:MAG TPA: hypothetical protein VFU47_13360, partial [Armatimonadota bacterium]|nr:hypothetical protein [Armatimonadota bacterium]